MFDELAHQGGLRRLLAVHGKPFNQRLNGRHTRKHALRHQLARRRQPAQAGVDHGRLAAQLAELDQAPSKHAGKEHQVGDEKKKNSNKSTSSTPKNVGPPIRLLRERGDQPVALVDGALQKHPCLVEIALV